jgi:hypothetical protein
MPIISVDPARIVIPAKAKTARHKGLSTGSPWGCMLATAASINVSGMRPRLASRGRPKSKFAIRSTAAGEEDRQ